MYYIEKQHGFTLVELITVIFVVGLLSVTAIPRFINVQDKAEIATLEGVAGGFISGITLVRAQWEVLGRPDKNPTLIKYGLKMIGVDEVTGYPTTGPDETRDTGAESITTEKCEDIFNTVLHNAPSVTASWAQEELKENRFYVFADEVSDICTYSSTQGISEINYDNKASFIAAAEKANRIIYNPSTGDVELILED